MLLVSLTLVPAGASAAGKVLRVRADAWLPFNGNPEAERPGYVVEILQAVFEPRGVKVNYETMGWAESLAAARAGKVDAVIGANQEEAEGLVMPKESVGSPRIGLFVRKDNAWAYDNVASLKDHKLGVIKDYSYWPSLDEYLKTAPAANVVTLEGDEPLLAGIEKLERGEIEVLAETMPVFVWAIRLQKKNMKDFRIAFMQAGEPIYVAFANTEDGRAWAQQLDTGLKEMRANGKLEALLKPYGLSDWTQ